MKRGLKVDCRRAYQPYIRDSVTTVTPMKRGLKAIDCQSEGPAVVTTKPAEAHQGTVGAGTSYNRYPDEKGTESHSTRLRLRGLARGASVTTVTPMKRGLKDKKSYG